MTQEDIDNRNKLNIEIIIIFYLMKLFIKKELIKLKKNIMIKLIMN